ncbi:MAG: hypothetical protein AAFM91_04060 [Pseudomonadota bacterium]
MNERRKTNPTLLTGSLKGLPVCRESAWRDVHRLYCANVDEPATGNSVFVSMDRRSSRLENNAVRFIHQYLLACCRRIWILLPDKGSRMGVMAAERYYQGKLSWQQVLEIDYQSEASAFLFDYCTSDDWPTIAGYVEEVNRSIQEAASLLVPPRPLHVDSIADLLKDAAYFANTAFVFPNLNMRAEQAKRLFKDYREFMPLPLYQQMALDWQQHQAAGRSRSA